MVQQSRCGTEFEPGPTTKESNPDVYLTEKINPPFPRMSDIDIQLEYRMHEMFGLANANINEPRAVSYVSHHGKVWLPSHIS